MADLRREGSRGILAQTDNLTDFIWIILKRETHMNIVREQIFRMQRALRAPS